MSKITNVQKVINTLLSNTNGKRLCVATIAKKAKITNAQTHSALSVITKKSAYTVTRKKVKLEYCDQKVWCYSLILKEQA